MGGYVIVDVDFDQHPKTRALRDTLRDEKIDDPAILCVRLWLYCRMYARDGVLEMTGREIERTVLLWTGTPGKAIEALRGPRGKARFIEPIRRGKAYRVHHWDEWSGRYTADLDRRAKAARDRRAKDKIKEEGQDVPGDGPGMSPERDGHVTDTSPTRLDQTRTDQKRRDQTGESGGLVDNLPKWIRDREAGTKTIADMFPAQTITNGTLGFLDEEENRGLLDSRHGRGTLACQIAGAVGADRNLAFVCLFLANRGRKRSGRDQVRSVAAYVTSLLNDRKFPIPEVAWEDCREAYNGREEART